jgi:DNA-binding NarL/FixJ family response regulator
MTSGAALLPAETSVEPISVVVAHERRLIADALGALIARMDRFKVASVVECDLVVDAVTTCDPDLVVVGVRSVPCPALEELGAHHDRHTRPQLVIVADQLCPRLVRLSLAERVSGLLLTDAPAWEVAACLNRIAHGHAVLPAGWQRALAAGADNPMESLSERQREVLELVAEGCSYQEIAARLCISLNTVKFHVRSVYTRLGVGNRMAAARVFSHGSDPAS